MMCLAKALTDHDGLAMCPHPLFVAIAGGDSCRARFPCHRVGLVVKQALGCALAFRVANGLHHAFARGQGVGIADPRVEHKGLIRLHKVASFLKASHKLRTHHASVVGDCIVQGKRLQRRLGHLIPNGHLGQAEASPAAMFCGSFDFGLGLSHIAKPGFFSHTNGLQSIEERLGLFAKRFFHSERRPDVGADLKHFGEWDGSVSSSLWLLSRIRFPWK